MKNILTYYYNLAKSKIIAPKVTHENIRSYLLNRTVVGDEPIYDAEKINEYIFNAIISGKPFLAGRFGATELFALRTFDFGVSDKYEKALEQMKNWSGFFPPEEQYCVDFKDLMLSLLPEADVMGVWMLPFESYYLNKYGNKNLKTCYLLDLEPWSFATAPWSAALEGKKVLVIHPFAETIIDQYKQRDEIFPNTKILPDFELYALKAVQTIAGEKNQDFDTWFDALNWMYNEALKIDFDVAIIGCGAYGFPLAAKLKQAGKQAVHLAGATQLLFGIKGKRWEESKDFAYVQQYFNSSWVRPSDKDKPKKANQVEGGCYW